MIVWDSRRGAARTERARPTVGLVTVLPEEFVAMSEARPYLPPSQIGTNF